MHKLYDRTAGTSGPRPEPDACPPAAPRDPATADPYRARQVLLVPVWPASRTWLVTRPPHRQRGPQCPRPAPASDSRRPSGGHPSWSPARQWHGHQLTEARRQLGRRAEGHRRGHGRERRPHFADRARRRGGIFVGHRSVCGGTKRPSGPGRRLRHSKLCNCPSAPPPLMRPDDARPSRACGRLP